MIGAQKLGVVIFSPFRMMIYDHVGVMIVLWKGIHQLESFRILLLTLCGFFQIVMDKGLAVGVFQTPLSKFFLGNGSFVFGECADDDFVPLFGDLADANIFCELDWSVILDAMVCIIRIMTRVVVNVSVISCCFICMVIMGYCAMVGMVASGGMPVICRVILVSSARMALQILIIF